MLNPTMRLQGEGARMRPGAAGRRRCKARHAPPARCMSGRNENQEEGWGVASHRVGDSIGGVRSAR